MDAAHDVSPGSISGIARKLTSGALLSSGDGMSKSALNAVSASSGAPLDTRADTLARERDNCRCVVFPNALTPEQGCKEFCLE
jgi:hypothetical protein